MEPDQIDMMSESEVRHELRSAVQEVYRLRKAIENAFQFLYDAIEQESEWMKALIDGDIIAYSVGFACDTVKYICRNTNAEYTTKKEADSKS